MTRAALIILDDEPPVARVLGLSWPEFQLRCAIRAGALHLVVVAGRVGRDVVEAIDRLRAEGFSVSLARTAAEVADLFHPDEVVLLLTGQSIVAEDKLAGLLAATHAVVLCVDGARAGENHELIDAEHCWTGIARLDGALIRATAATVGEWDLASMLLRKAVATRTERIVLGSDDALADVADPVAMAAATQWLIGREGPTPSGWGARWVIGPLVGLTVRHLSMLLPSLARFGQWLAAVLLVIAPVAAWQLWTTGALVLFLIAILVASAAQRAASITGIVIGGGAALPALRDGVGVLVLGMIAVRALPDSTPLVLASGITAFMALADRLNDREAGPTSYGLADVPGHAIILLVASFVGTTAMPAAIGLCALHGLVSLTVLQNRLSRVLTSPR